MKPHRLLSLHLALSVILFAVDAAAHAASNVPMLGRVTRGSSSLGNVKPRPEK